MGAGNSLQDHCEWEETLSHGPWTVRSGKLHDGTQISLFTPLKSNKPSQSLLRSLTKQMKIIRHPSVIHYVAAEDEECGPFLMTERVAPLSSVLPSLTSLEICAGLQSILEALAFLHEKVGVCHNNICLSSVYVCPDGSWRLGGLEHSCKFAKATTAFLTACKEQRDPDSVSPEEKRGPVAAEAGACCARDIYALAVMTETLLEKMEDLDDLTKTFELRIQDECFNEDPGQRPSARCLLEDRLFRCEFLEIESFLKSITLKTEEERQEFFKNLLPKLHKLPEGVIGRRLVPMLLARFVFLDQSAVEYVLPSLLTPCKEVKRKSSIEAGQVTPLLTEPMYQQHVVPRLVRIFGVQDHHIHCLMLEYFSLYVHLIDKEQLEHDVFPQVLLGLRDTSAQIAALSLHALAELVPILGRDVVVGGQSKTFFKEGRPKIPNSMLDVPNNKMANVQGVMEKVLLKELASMGKEKSLKEDKEKSLDKEKKLREREKRREEMKKRREERKLARAKAGAMGEVPSTGPVSPDTTDPTLDTTDHINEEINQQEATETKHETNSYIVSDSDSDARNDDSKSKVTILYTDEEGDDWADLDNKGEYSAISDDIEKELQNMGNLNSSEISVFPGDKLENDTLKLPDKSRFTSTTAGKPLTLTKGSKTKSNGSAKPKSNNDLFSGAFDIKSVDIQVEETNDPFDFFADMKPTIAEPSKPSIMTVQETEEKPAEKTADKTKISFDVVPTTSEAVEDGLGWEDEDW